MGDFGPTLGNIKFIYHVKSIGLILYRIKYYFGIEVIFFNI